MNKQGIILIGGGGHCKSVIDVIEAENKFEIKGILDLKEKKGEKILGYEIVGTDDEIETFSKRGLAFHLTLGHIKSAEGRYKLYTHLKKVNAKLPALCSPTAYVSKHARLGEGTVILHHAVVNADVHIGANCIINSRALIEHDTVIGDHCHVSTGAIVNGNCKVAHFSFVGSQSVLIQGVEIGENCMIGAGSVVTKSWPANTILVGNPAKIK